MLVFVDESGDTGLKLSQGSSDFFTIALVVFEENSEAQAVDDRITLLRRELKRRAHFEFHFAHNSEDVRRKFFQAVIPYNFFYFGYGINKSHLNTNGLEHKEAFYKFACGLVFESAKPYLDNAIVRFDANGSQEFEGELGRYLRRKINDPAPAKQRIRKVRSDDSQHNNLLQLADMICGAIGRSLRAEGIEAQRYRKIIKHREISVRTLPE